MISRSLNFAVRWAVLCAGLVILASPTAHARGKGCDATCAKGECNTSNQYSDCGCCDDGTPYCGSSASCKNHAGLTFANITFEVVSVGGAGSTQPFLEALYGALQPTEASVQFVKSVEVLAAAILSGRTAEAQAAQLITVERFDALEEGDDLVALRVALASLTSPGAR